MKKYKDFLINIGLFTLNSIATKLMAFILMPLYTLYLSTSEYGIMDMSIIVINMLFPLLSICIGDGVLRFMVEDPGNNKFYVTEGTIVILGGTVLVALCLPILDLRFFGGLGNYKILFLLSYIFGSFPAYQGSVARGLNQIKLMPIVSICSSMTMAVLAFLFIAIMKWNINGYFYSYIIGNAVAIILYLFVGKHYKCFSFSEWKKKKKLRCALWKYSFPLAPNSLCNTAGTTFSRFIITNMLGISASGMYAAASKIPNLLNVVQQIVSQAWQISIFQEYKKTNIKHFYETVWKLYNAAMLIGCSLLIVLISPLSSILLQREFYAAWKLIPILIFAFYLGAVNTFLGTIYEVYMKTKPLLIAAFIGAVLCVGLTAIGIPYVKIVGAALAVLFSNLIIFIIRICDTRRLLKIDLGWASLFFSWLIILIQCSVTWNSGSSSISQSIVCFVLLLFIQIIHIIPLFKQFLRTRGDSR